MPRFYVPSTTSIRFPPLLPFPIDNTNTGAIKSSVIYEGLFFSLKKGKYGKNDGKEWKEETVSKDWTESKVGERYVHIMLNMPVYTDKSNTFPLPQQC